MSRIEKKGILKKMFVIVTVIISLFTVVFGVWFYTAFIYKPNGILRVALKEREIAEEKYILCRLYRVTGYDWFLIQDENGEDVNDFIYITGANPIADLKLSYEFEMGRSTYIFYIEKRHEVYSELLGENVVEYVVTSWDILYPVRRITFISPRRYITEADVRKSAP